MPYTQQVHLLNQALRAQYLPAQSASFEPSRSNPRSSKLVIWSHDWLCTVRLDLDLITRTPSRKTSIPGSPSDVSRSLRKKRAREAKEQLDLVSASLSPSIHSSERTGTPTLLLHARGPSSANDPDFFKISNDGFRAVVAVDWLGQGELCVVERPYGDYVGELPAAFSSGGFGRS